MNKKRFIFLVLLMSISLVGIIMVQVYWIKQSLESNKEQFAFTVQQVLTNVSEQLNSKEMIAFYKQYNKIKDSIGKAPETSQLKEIFFYERDAKTNETIVYSSTLSSQDYGIDNSFFDKNNNTVFPGNLISHRKTQVFNEKIKDNGNIEISKTPDITIEKSGNINALDKINFEIAFKDIVSLRAIQERISVDELNNYIKRALLNFGIKTPYNFAIYSNGIPTDIKSENFKSEAKNIYSVPIFKDNENHSQYNLLLEFPQKEKFLFSSLIKLVLLSLLFTTVIVVTYLSAINQLLTQKQISEIKTDFINNMTHEFKTPIATINLALDAIKNPKVYDDKEKVNRYLQMIKDENKRMHAQVENVLRISKLEKKELNIDKQSINANEIIEDAVEHISLLLEDKNGEIQTEFHAKRTNILANDVHLTNVLVNILDNAIKYSIQAPKIVLSTENIKDYLFIKIKDNGIGMSKTAQKKVFDKFYREHTGDVHNVKGHGLGLAYVKQVIEDHGGSITVDSEKHKGSIFTIKLPLIN